jgi:hypothetical protein
MLSIIAVRISPTQKRWRSLATKKIRKLARVVKLKKRKGW